MRKILLLAILLIAVIAVSAYSLRRHVSQLPEIPPHLVGPNDLLTSNENTLTPQEKELKHAAFSILLAQGNATQESYENFSLHAVGRRYLLMQFLGESEHYPGDYVIDLKQKKAYELSAGGYTFDTKDAVIYIAADEVSYYIPGTNDALAIQGTKLSDSSSETYESRDGMLPGPVETHTDTSLSIGVFSFSEPAAPGSIEYKKLREVTVSLP